jgi:hypothetical protein
MAEVRQAALGEEAAELQEHAQRHRKLDDGVSSIRIRPLFAFSGVVAVLVLLVGIAAEFLQPGVFSVATDSLLQPVAFFFPARSYRPLSAGDVFRQQAMSALEKLDIRGGILRPLFSPNISEYQVDIDDFEPHVVPSIDLGLSLSDKVRQEQLRVRVHGKDFSCDKDATCLEVQRRV